MDHRRVFKTPPPLPSNSGRININGLQQLRALRNFSTIQRPSARLCLQIGLPESHDYYVEHGNPFLSSFSSHKFLGVNHIDVLFHGDTLITLLQSTFQQHDAIIYAVQLGSYYSVFLHMVKSLFYVGGVITSYGAPIGYWRNLWDMLGLPPTLMLPTPCSWFLKALSFNFCTREIHISFNHQNDFYRFVSATNSRWFGPDNSFIAETLKDGNLRSFDFGVWYQQVAMYDGTFESLVPVTEVDFDTIFSSLVRNRPCHVTGKDNSQQSQVIHVGTVFVDVSTAPTTTTSCGTFRAVEALDSQN
jgi:hypothetical protein